MTKWHASAGDIDTAWPTSIVAQMIAAGAIRKPGGLGSGGPRDGQLVVPGMPQTRDGVCLSPRGGFQLTRMRIPSVYL